MYIGLHEKYPLLLSDFNETWNFLDRFFKNTQVSNLMNIRYVGAVLFHANSRTDRRTCEASSRFSQFCERAWRGKPLHKSVYYLCGISQYCCLYSYLFHLV